MHREPHFCCCLLATATNVGESFSGKKDWKQAKNLIVHGYFTVSIAEEKIILRKSLHEIDVYTPVGEKYKLLSEEQIVHLSSWRMHCT